MLYIMQYSGTSSKVPFEIKSIPLTVRPRIHRLVRNSARQRDHPDIKTSFLQSHHWCCYRGFAAMYNTVYTHCYHVLRNTE